MGNWVETCILSKLPIEEGEHCVMLVSKNNEGLLADVFDINMLNRVFSSNPFPDMQIYKGAYEGRGTLEGMEEYDNTIFVNHHVWTWLSVKYDYLDLARTKQSYREDFEEDLKRFPRLNRDYVWEYMQVSYSASLLRLLPNSLKLKGATYIRLEEFGEWLDLLTHLNNNKIKTYNEDE